MTDGVTASRHGAAHVLTLDRAESGNSLSPSLVAALHAALDAFERGGGRVLVLRGAGRNFCTGFDLSDLADCSDADLLARFVQIELLLARIWNAPWPTIAVVQGRAMGAGADLATVCSRRIAVEEASFAFPGAAFGLVLGTRRLAVRIGSEAAEHLVTSGMAIDAAQAVTLGLASMTCTAADVSAMLDREVTGATRLDAQTVAAVRWAANDDAAQVDHDLAALVRSAAIPGIGARIAAYRAATRPRPISSQES